MVFMPPGSAKSTYANILFSAYYLGRNPNNLLITASYGQDLATNFGAKTRNVFSSPQHATLFGQGLDASTRAKHNWQVETLADGLYEGSDDEGRLVKKGAYLAVGAGASITGNRGHGGIIDDPVKGREDADSPRIQTKTYEWYLSDFRTRLLPGAFIIIIQTRWNPDDLSGKILPKDWDGRSGRIMDRDGVEEWDVVAMPAIVENDVQAATDPLGRKLGEPLWPDFYGLEHWEREKRVQGERNWFALYQQIPTPETGSYFKREWFETRRYTLGDEPKEIKKYLHSDFAVTSDKDANDPDWTEFYVSGHTKDGDLYLALDSWYGQEPPDIWLQAWLDLRAKHTPACEFHEGGVIRRAVEPFLTKMSREQRKYARVEWLSPIGDKEARARGLQGMASAGRVYIPHGPVGDRLLAHLLMFPGSNMDHSVDACSVLTRGLDMLGKPAKETPKPVRRRPPRRNQNTNGYMTA